jgi:hypothetical protein
MVSVEEPFFSPQNATFLSIIFKMSIVALLTDLLFRMQRLRLSIGNEEVLL